MIKHYGGIVRILIIGAGGREHALAWKISKSPLVKEIFVAPGNGGTTEYNVAISDSDIPALVAFAKEKNIDFVVPGPELALTLGITDAMQAAGIPCFGPSKDCATLEGSKSFSKKAMEDAHIPTAAYGVFTDIKLAHTFIDKHGASSQKLVVKADGLAAGKGVIIAQTLQEAHDAVDLMISDKKFGDAGNKVIIEEFLVGEELSLLCFCDGESALALPSAQDHKALGEGDTGANTGGMGAYSPAPLAQDEELEKLADIAVRPLLAEMAKRGTPFKGILYAGLMMTENGPKVLEYNVRFGDPECQPLLMRLESDIIPIMQACVEGSLRKKNVQLKINPKSALGVVWAAKGYPESYPKGMEITGIKKANSMQDVMVFQAGTRFEKGKILSNGGRILCISALGNTLHAAKTRAYEALAHIHMEDAYYRRDIGDKGIKRLENKGK